MAASDRGCEQTPGPLIADLQRYRGFRPKTDFLAQCGDWVSVPNQGPGRSLAVR